MTCAEASESAAARKVAPVGMTTRTGGPDGSQAATIIATPMRAGVLVRERQRMLQKYRGGEGVNVPFSAAGGLAHLAHGTQGLGGGEAFIDIPYGETGAAGQLAAPFAGISRPRGLVAIAVEGQADDQALDFQLLRPPRQLGDRRTLACAPQNVAGR